MSHAHASAQLSCLGLLHHNIWNFRESSIGRGILLSLMFCRVHRAVCNLSGDLSAPDFVLMMAGPHAITTTAIKLAMQGGAGTSRDTDTEHDKRRNSSSLPVLKMDNDDAGTWTLALKFIDPMRLGRPEIDWVGPCCSKGTIYPLQMTSKSMHTAN